MSRMLHAMSVVAVLAVAAGCDVNDGSHGGGNGGVSIPEGKSVVSIRWLSDGWIYLSIAGDSDLPDEFWRGRPGGKPGRVGSPAPEGDCLHPYPYGRFLAVGDELGTLAHCGNEDLLISWTPQGGRAKTLAHLPDKRNERFWVGAAAGRDRVFVARSHSCSRVAKLDAGAGFADPGIVVPMAGGQFSIGRDFADDTACLVGEDVELPTLSRDGGRLYFVATTQAAGRTSSGREASLESLYVADAGGGSARSIAAGLHTVRDVAVSPDESQSAVATRYFGASLIDNASGAVRRISSMPCYAVSFSPDGREVAMLVDDESGKGPSRQKVMVARVG